MNNRHSKAKTDKTISMFLHSIVPPFLPLCLQKKSGTRSTCCWDKWLIKRLRSSSDKGPRGQQQLELLGFLWTMDEKLWFALKILFAVDWISHTSSFSANFERPANDSNEIGPLITTFCLCFPGHLACKDPLHFNIQTSSCWAVSEAASQRPCANRFEAFLPVKKSYACCTPITWCMLGEERALASPSVSFSSKTKSGTVRPLMIRRCLVPSYQFVSLFLYLISCGFRKKKIDLF